MHFCCNSFLTLPIVNRKISFVIIVSCHILSSKKKKKSNNFRQITKFRKLTKMFLPWVPKTKIVKIQRVFMLEIEKFNCEMKSGKACPTFFVAWQKIVGTRTRWCWTLSITDPVYSIFSKLSELLEEVKRSKYSLSIVWHNSTRFLCCRTIEARRVSGRGVVRMLNRWPKTRASNSVGL